MPRTLLVLISLFISINCFTQSYNRIKVGLFWGSKPYSATLQGRTGQYLLKANGKVIHELNKGDLVQIENFGGKVKISSLYNFIGTFNEVTLSPKDSTSTYYIQPKRPEQKRRIYQDKLIVTGLSNGELKMIADVTMPNYVAGVVQSESGNGQDMEFYKVQAIICRTYALKNWNKYKSDGFNLCDRVNSQVMKTMCLNDSIRKAVQLTKDVVLVDADIQLISAVFHSNSGGVTTNSEDVWQSALPYLRSVSDTFSLEMPHYRWEVKMPARRWLNYLQHQQGVDLSDSTTIEYVLSYCPNKRYVYLFPETQQVELKKIRTDLSLRSTWFCVSTQGDEIVIFGKGFGHGVGLSQEGAMAMANAGRSYQEILQHYYQNVHLIKLSSIDFFKE